MSRTAVRAMCAISLALLMTSAAYGQVEIFANGFESGDCAEWSDAIGCSTTLTVLLPGDVPLELELVPAGTFLMGSPVDERGREDQEDLHAVTLTTSYYIGKYEVTQGQWMAVMGNNPSDPADPSSCALSDWGVGASHPVSCVSWEDIAGAGGFIELLNAYLSSTGQEVGFRLPTEAEWERAARSGTQSEFSFDTSANPEWPVSSCVSFPEADPYMWWCGNNAADESKEVGTKGKNAYGLYDMHGNLRELVSDRWQVHLGYEGQVDPTGPTTGEYRVRRGGAWPFYAQYCRSAVRFVDGPSNRDVRNGFRLARSQ